MFIVYIITFTGKTDCYMTRGGNPSVNLLPDLGLTESVWLIPGTWEDRYNSWN
jgi:hypothetical protein